MIINEIYTGQGLGNQLHNYVTTRVVALDKGYDFGIMCPHRLKCNDFIDLDFGKPIDGGIESDGPTNDPSKFPNGITNYFREWIIRHPNGSDITIDDPKFEEISDNTKIDGNFQSENRIIHRKDEIKQWFKIKPEYDCYDYSSDDICILNFRGGDYAGDYNFFLNMDYWANGISRMLKINPKFKFIVISDDPRLASIIFPTFPVYHFSIGKDFTIIKNAHYLILSNSSFSYFPTFISEKNKYIIAPKYWGRHNISDGYWHCGYNIFRKFNYIDRQNNIFTYDQCVAEFEDYKLINKHFWE